MSLSLFGIILGLVLLMFLAYKGYSIIWSRPCLRRGGGRAQRLCHPGRLHWRLYEGHGRLRAQWFPAFFLGAVYGKVMDLTGSARSLGNALVKLIGPRFAVAAVVIPCLLMTYGGISCSSWCSSSIPWAIPSTGPPTCPAPCCPAPLPPAPSASP